jgi:hypothetical protein
MFFLGLLIGVVIGVKFSTKLNEAFKKVKEKLGL